MIKVADYVEHYRKDAELYDYFAEQHPADADSARRIQQAVLRAAQIPSGGIVVDVGSGNGWLLRDLAGRHNTVISVDLGIKNLWRLTELFGNDAAPVSADAATLPFAAASVDRVIASEILEHMNEPEALIREAFRILKPGGILVVSTPYREKLRTYLCVHCNQPTPANAHIQSFDELRHRKQAETAGFKDIRYFLLQNKLFVKSRLSYLLRWIPYFMWRFCDGICNLVIRRANTIVLWAEKPNL